MFIPPPPPPLQVMDAGDYGYSGTADVVCDTQVRSRASCTAVRGLFCPNHEHVPFHTLFLWKLVHMDVVVLIGNGGGGGYLNP